MEADWEVELGPEAPIIDALWSGFVDLQASPQLIHEIEEARDFPALADTLLRLNAPITQPIQQQAPISSLPGLSIWTAKCDLWMIDSNSFDPYEMNATAAESVAGLACYIDLLPRAGQVFASLEDAKGWSRAAIEGLHQHEALCCRTELIIRRAFAEMVEGFGITAYLSACGSDIPSARAALAIALATFAHTLTGALGEAPSAGNAG